MITGSDPSEDTHVPLSSQNKHSRIVDSDDSDEAEEMAPRRLKTRRRAEQEAVSSDEGSPPKKSRLTKRGAPASKQDEEDDVMDGMDKSSEWIMIVESFCSSSLQK